MPNVYLWNRYMPRRSLAVGMDSVWVLGHKDGVVVRVDTMSNQVLARIRLGGPHTFGTGIYPSILVSHGAVWVTELRARWSSGIIGPTIERLPGTLWKIDPRTNTVAARIEIEADPKSMTAQGGFIWVSTLDWRQKEGNTQDCCLVMVDPGRNKVVNRLCIPGRGQLQLVSTAEETWGFHPYGVVDEATHLLTRVRPHQHLLDVSPTSRP